MQTFWPSFHDRVAGEQSVGREFFFGGSRLYAFNFSGEDDASTSRVFGIEGLGSTVIGLGKGNDDRGFIVALKKKINTING